MQSKNDGFLDDGLKFRNLAEDHFRAAYEKLAFYVRRNFQRKYKKLFDILLPYSNELRGPFDENQLDDEKSEVISGHLYDLKRKKGAYEALGVYLAWISATDPDYAKEVYQAAGLSFRAYQGDPHPARATEIRLKSPSTKSPTDVVADLAPVEDMIKENVPRELRNFYKFDFPEFFKAALGQSGASDRIKTWQRSLMFLGIALLVVLLVSVGISLTANQKISDLQVTIARDTQTGELRPVVYSSEYGLYTEGTEAGLRQRVPNETLVQHYQSKIEQEREKLAPSLKRLSQLHVLLGQALSYSDIEASSAAFETAVTLDGKSSIARQAYSMSLLGAGRYQDATKELEMAEAFADTDNPVEMLLLANTRSYWLMLRNDDPDNIVRVIQDMLRFAEQITDEELILQTRYGAINRLVFFGKKAEAEALIEASPEACDQIEIRRLVGLCFEAKSVLAIAKDREDDFYSLQRKALASYEQERAFFAALNIKTNLVQDVARTEGIEKALKYAQANLEEARAANYLFGEMQALRSLSSLYSFYFQRHDLALEYALQELPLREASPDRKTLGELQEWIGLKYEILKQPEESARYYKSALDIAVWLNHDYAVLARSSNLYTLYNQLQRYDEASELYELGNKILDKHYKQPADIIKHQEYLNALIHTADTRQIPILEDLLAYSQENDLFTAQIEALRQLALIHTGTEKSLHYRYQEIEFLRKLGVEEALADRYAMLGLSARAMGDHEKAWSAFNSAKAARLAQGEEIDTDLAFELLVSGTRTGLLDSETRRNLFEITRDVRLQDIPRFNSRSYVAELIKVSIALRERDKLNEYLDYAISTNAISSGMTELISVVVAGAVATNDVETLEMFASYYEELITYEYGHCTHCPLIYEWIKAPDAERALKIQEFLDTVD